MQSKIIKIISDGKDDRFLCRLQSDPLYTTFKSSVEISLKKLYQFFDSKYETLSSLEVFINNYVESSLKERVNKFQDIAFKLSKADREFIDGSNGALQNIFKQTLKSIGCRAEAVTYYSRIKSSKNEIEQLINDFSTYLRGIYSRELSAYTQADKNSKIELVILVEKNIKDRLDVLATSLLYFISDLDKGTENIRNLNKTAELLCQK